MDHATRRVTVQCERCGAGPAGADLFDWCGLCGLPLCDGCMAAGCCGQTPAISGLELERERVEAGRPKPPDPVPGDRAPTS